MKLFHREYSRMYDSPAQFKYSKINPRLRHACKGTPIYCRKLPISTYLTNICRKYSLPLQRIEISNKSNHMSSNSISTKRASKIMIRNISPFIFPFTNTYIYIYTIAVKRIIKFLGKNILLIEKLI